MLWTHACCGAHGGAKGPVVELCFRMDLTAFFRLWTHLQMPYPCAACVPTALIVDAGINCLASRGT